MFDRIAIEQYEYRNYPHLGIVLQSYLRDTDLALEGLLGWTKDEGLPFSIRLVKGAYWDYETVTDKQNEFSEYIKNLSRKYIH